MFTPIRQETKLEWIECVVETWKPEAPGELLQDCPDVLKSSSVLHDDVAAYTARIRSVLRKAVLTTLLCAELWTRGHDHSASFQLATKWQRGCEVQAEENLLNSGVLVERSGNHSESNSRKLLCGHARNCRQR